MTTDIVYFTKSSSHSEMFEPTPSLRTREALEFCPLMSGTKGLINTAMGVSLVY